MLGGRRGGRPSRKRAIEAVAGRQRDVSGTHPGKKERDKDRKKPEGRPTPGALVSCVLAVESGAVAAAAAAAAAVELALVTSRRLEPALLATLRILDPPPLPFFSLAVGVSALESS
jgi:hypothetical protein